MHTLTILLFILGLGGLVAGAELLVRGASRLAAAFGISPLVIGLTIVAYGTSTPEMAVSVKATLAGQPDIVMGNAVGSNIFNIFFILGISALITPLVVSQQLVRLDVPLMIGVSALLCVLLLDGKLDRLDGLILLTGIVAYTVFAIRKSRKETADVKAEYAKEFGPPASEARERATFIHVVLIVVGLGLCVVGARWMVNGAIGIARALGVSELIIGLTIVAAGTSLPEVATSIMAAIRGQRDIAIGNVVGSNIYNILAILGVSGLIAPHGINAAPSILWFDSPVMIAASVACLPIFFTGHVIARWEGALFLSYYLAYLTYVVLDAQQHDALARFSAIMLWFVVPLTVVTVTVVTMRTMRNSMTQPRRAR